MRVWVTGAAGFVGEAVVRRLAARGDEVVAIARPRSAHRVDRSAAELAIADLPDLSALSRSPDPDVIVHCAADLHREDFAHARRVHVDATVALADRAPRAKLVHLSTTDVFAAETSEEWIDESSPLGPRDVYGKTKLEGEEAIRGRAVILRPPGIYGPWSRGDGVLDIIRKIARGRFFHVGDGSGRRSWVHVENLVDAIVHAFDLEPDVYVVDDGAPIERLELSRLIARALGVSDRFLHVPIPVAEAVAIAFAWLPMEHSPLSMRGVRFRIGGFPLDTRKLKSTGFQPSRTIPEAIEETVA
ncbi:MAG: NAD-dependent epimerase/dehydratase family protein, partial [Polyangiales bacterium]